MLPKNGIEANDHRKPISFYGLRGCEKHHTPRILIPANLLYIIMTK